jgi:exopolyphosphatase/guanosine-5'-triphosphate,3'-diphosphate pyrophosphatase
LRKIGKNFRRAQVKIAIIDIGTNTFKLMIVKIGDDGTFKVVFKEKIPVKLGEGGINNQQIAHSPFLRGIKAMITHKESIDKHGVEHVMAFATSAIRSAKNGQEFAQKVKSVTGIEIEIISGDREAELIYYGVRRALNLGKEKCLIMDIGGGSTEFIIADQETIYWKHSFDLGAARLLEVINPSEPIEKSEIKYLKTYLKEELGLLWDACKKYELKTLVGSSGSFDSMAEMIYHRFHTDENPLIKTEYHFDLKHFEAMYKVIVSSPVEKRYKIKGLAAMRVEMIVVAVILIRFVFKELELEQMRLSTYSLKEGILYQHLQQQGLVG